MAHSLPCLISDLEVHREITAYGTAAMLFRNGDVSDLRSKLQELIDDASLRTAYSTAGYQRVETAYNADVALKSYLWAFGLGLTRQTDSEIRSTIGESTLHTRTDARSATISSSFDRIN
jgi:hypothetical protein